MEQHIISLGKTLDKKEYYCINDNIWISKKANISETSVITGPAIIGEYVEVRHCAYIRENVILGKNVVVGNSCEIKNSILFDEVKVSHLNYVGDSILGFKSHLGAGAITSNVKSDGSLINVKYKDKIIETNLCKFGTILGDNVEVGCNSVLAPGSIIGKSTQIYPCVFVRGMIDSNCIVKDNKTIVKKHR